MRARADAEAHVRLAQAELLVEDLRELVVVVLARVRDDEVDVLRELGVQRRRLDELRARPGDGEQAHRWEGTRIPAHQYLYLQGFQCASNKCNLVAMEELEGSARGVSLRAAACMLAGDARDPVVGERVRRAVDAQLRRAGVEAQDAGDVRTDVVLALLARARRRPSAAARAGLRARRGHRAQQGRRSRAPPVPARRSRSARPPRAASARASARDRSPTGSTRSTALAHRRRVRADLARALAAPGRSAAGGHPRARRAAARRVPPAFRARPTTARSHMPRRACAAICAGASPASAALGDLARGARELFAHVEAVHAAAAGATAAVAVGAALALSLRPAGTPPRGPDADRRASVGWPRASGRRVRARPQRARPDAGA